MTPGTRLGPYEIQQPLGAGGMGVVYRARDTRLDREVAIKLLPAHLSESGEARERLRREARAIAAIQHPNICAIFDVGDADQGQMFLVLELLAGETLQQRLQRGVLPEPEAADIAIALAGALSVAHAAGIVHRDIKPANIFLTAHGPKLLDFGLAKGTATSAPDGVTVPLVTGHGQIVGTAAYMSPEQLEGQPLDGRTDIYSLGVTLGEMLTGTRTFTAGRHPALDACIVRATERSRDLRFQTIGDFRSALLHARHTASTPAAAAPPRVRSRRALPVALAALVVAAVIAGVLYVRQPRVQALTEKDTIVIADFTNTTGDTVFDDALRQGLAVQLQQSPFLSIVPDTRIRRTIGLMGRSADTPLTGEIASEVCARVGGTALLEGSIAPIGTRYAVGLKATTCADNETFDRQQTEVATKDDVLRAVGDLASRFREHSGESLASRQRYATPLPEATTSSLDALKAYSASMRANYTGGTSSGLPLARRAVEIDPSFALAWAMLGLDYSTVGELKNSIDAAARAYQLRDRATDRERFLITGLYERGVTGNLERAREIFDTFARTYPRDAEAHGLLSGFSTLGTGHYQQAIEHATLLQKLDPQIWYGYSNSAYAYLCLGQFDRAEALLQRAEAAGLHLTELDDERFVIAFTKDGKAALEHIDATKPSSVSDKVVLMRAMLAIRQDRWDDARGAMQQAIAMATAANQREVAGVYHGMLGIWEAMAGHAPQARLAAARALELSDGREATYAAALALMQLRDPRADALTAQLAERFPEDTSVRYSYLPTLRGLQALRSGDAARALSVLEDARANELGMPALAFMHYASWAYPSLVRAHAYRALGRKDDAIAELRRILDHRGLVQTDPIAATVERDLGELSPGH